MAKKKRKRGPARPVAGQSAPRPKTQAGPRRSDLQRAAYEKAQRRQKMRRAGGIAGVVLVGATAIAGVVALDRRGDAQLRAELTSGTCEVDTRTDPTGPAGRNHVGAATYAVNPPAGGDHLPSAVGAGVYEGSSVPDDGQLVHSLEHGYVVVWYSPDLPEDQKEQLVDLQSRNDQDVIVAERADLPVPVAATAWGQRLLCEQVEAEPFDRFVEERVGDGPEDVPRR